MHLPHQDITYFFWSACQTMHANQSQRSQAIKVIASCRGKHDVSTWYIAQALARGMRSSMQWHQEERGHSHKGLHWCR